MKDYQELDQYEVPAMQEIVIEEDVEMACACLCAFGGSGSGAGPKPDSHE